MPGKIVRVVVEEGQEVEAGQPLLIMVCTFPVNPSYAQ
jgi:acetyl/propionyl-CoA carboxylase alpha subunit